jgi:adenosine deaminase
VRTLPKAHLHLHFTGSMRPATLEELAGQHRIRLLVVQQGSDQGNLALVEEMPEAFAQPPRTVLFLDRRRAG